ncbi:MAG: DUF4424 domain-containing protein [Sphingomicrobium sp.]
MRLGLVLAAALGASAPAAANDTTASTGAGGLVLERTDAIDMASEDLFVSADEISIRYVFRNRTQSDVETIVAFPMPGRDLAREFEGGVTYPSGFRTRVDGRAVTASLERKALVDGKDHSALLQQLSVPVAPQLIDEATRAMDRLPAAQKQRILKLGLAGEQEYDDDGKGIRRHLVPLWTVKDTWWWTQRFPAGRDLIVEHRYEPGAGSSVQSPIAIPEYRSSEDGARTIARYCMDRQFLAAVDRLGSADGTPGSGAPDRRIDYILTTGANWRSPIGEFRLVVDKGRPENLVSFCETGVKKISPTQFEVRHTNWRPTRDLHVLIIEPQR